MADKDTENPGRRKFLKNTGIAAGGVVGGSLLGGFLTTQFTDNESTQKETENNESSFQQAQQFFYRPEDFAVLKAATERIFPKDKNGPGAIDLDVPYFIDRQLAGSWGMNAKDYRQAPFIKYEAVENVKGKEQESLPPNPQGAQGQDKKLETENQRHQSRLTRGDIFLEGIRKMNHVSQKRFETSFDKADKDQQIAIIKDIQKGTIAMNGVAAENFFILLRQATLEGAYSDPMHGGNKNMQGWKMKEFPGAQTSYANVIEQDEFADLKPVSLNNYQGH
ncbi:gluconate 2-dehydrogenase subunit 3 family protein [Barrientosiimonas marina]|uniref:Gluconate 2-dehydrogenase subunit 3 family protein n=1 Tax=Lentibacillus kimchii TaxID=1542911 RepID=A0ABW2URH5_9BACI